MKWQKLARFEKLANKETCHKVRKKGKKWGLISLALKTGHVKPLSDSLGIQAASAIALKNRLWEMAWKDKALINHTIICF